jgi:hypothetical protein
MDVILAAMRRPAGASAARLMAVRRGEITMLANVALALEYEATCRRAEHGVAAGLSPAQVGIFVDAVIALAEPVQTHRSIFERCRVDAGRERGARALC